MNRDTYFISAAEPSADAYGGELIRAMRTRSAAASFVGVGGPRMAEAGCEIICDLTQRAGMLTGVFSLLATGWRLLRQVNRLFQERSISAAVVIDSPTLHLPMARLARRQGIPLLYYVAPQMWAWGAWRIGRLRRRTTCVAVILPFEEEYFRERGVNVSFVGHPLFELLDGQSRDVALEERLRKIGQPLIALLPGSRKHVVSEVFPHQLEVAAGIHAVFPQSGCAVSIANAGAGEVVRECLARSGSRVPFACVEGSPREAIAAADLVLVASGTSTLEVAYHRKPMIVMYNASRMLYQVLGRWLLTTPHLSLPNILAGRRIVPEFMPFIRSTTPITQCSLGLLRDGSGRETMSAELGQLAARLAGGGASARVAELLESMVSSGGRGTFPGGKGGQ